MNSESTSTTASAQDSAGGKLRVDYEITQVLHVSQCLLNTTPDEVIFDFSSGVLTDPDTGQPVLPIQSRLAMSKANARRLHELLGRTLGAAAAAAVNSSTATASAGPVPSTTPKVTARPSAESTGQG